jgi:general stress protein 26
MGNQGLTDARGAEGAGPMDQVRARPLAERRKAAMQRLRSSSNLWLATASGGRPHLIPLAYTWDGVRLTTATFEGSRTLKNVRAQPKVRAAIGTTGDVLMIDATATIASVADIADIAEVAARYAQASGNDPRSVPGFVYIQLTPERIQLWKGAAEFTGRTVMRAGVWLDDPID